MRSTPTPHGTDDWWLWLLAGIAIGAALAWAFTPATNEDRWYCLRYDVFGRCTLQQPIDYAPLHDEQ